MAEVVRATEDKTRKDFFLLYALQPQLQVLPRTCVVRLHIVTQQAQNLHRVLQHTHMHAAAREVRKDYFCIDAEVYMTGNENETEYLWLQDPLSIKKRTHPVWHHDQLLGFTNGSGFQLSKDNSTHILQTRKPTVRGNIQVNALQFADR